MERKRSGGVGDEAGQRQKKPRLGDSDSEESDFSAHAIPSDDISSPISARERSYSVSPPPTQEVDMMSDSSESFPLTKSKGSEASRKRKERHYRSGHGGHHSEKDSRKPQREDSLRRRDKYSHSRSPAPSRGATRDRPLRGETLKRESSSGRNSPLYIDERSRDSLRGDRYGRESDHDDGRYHDRLTVPPRMLTVREDSRLSDRRGSREQKEMYERGGGGGGGHRDIKLTRAGSRGGGGERGGRERGGGSFSLTRDDRRPSLKGSRSPRRTHTPSERSRHGPPSSHLSREEQRERQRKHHHQAREGRREKRHGSRHHGSREERREVSSVVSSVMETISSGSEEEERASSREVRSPEGGGGAEEKIEELIRDLESGSSSGEVSEEESEEGGAKREKEGKEQESHSEKDKSSDGEIHSPPAESKGKPHAMRSKFDSETESESDDEPKSKGVPLSSLAATSGYHDVVMSDEEHSGMSDIEDHEERAEEKESDLSAQLSRELEDVERSPTPVELPCYLPALMGCRNVEENYDYLNKIEEGTYGVVHRAKDKKTGKVFALKRLKLENEKEGFPITSLREIDMLLKARHPNVVGVREIVLAKNMDRIYIVFEYVEHDLKELMETMKQPFLQGEVKTLMIQLLRAVHHLHDNWIIHRDLKASNLLVSHQAILKVADFGLAREYGSPLRKYTPIVVTLWYRSPELLLGAPEYSTPVDIWSVGCIFAEMMLQKPLFQGKGEIDQLNQIFKLLGTPNEQIWKGYNDLPTVKKVTFTNQPYNHLRKKFPPSLITQNGFDLLNRFLTYDPKKRITAKEALDHPYFKEPPMPIPPSMFNTWPAKSEMGHRKKAKSPTPPVGGAFQFAEDGPGFNLKF